MMNKNPESAYCRRQIVEDRAARRRSGAVGMLLMGSFLAAFTIFAFLMDWHMPIPLWSFLQMYVLVAVMLAGMFYLLGFEQYQQGRQPITEQEIEQRRRAERTRLFRQAQGHRPFMSRPWFLFLLTFAGLLFAAGGVACFVFPLLPSGWSIVYGAGLLICALLFLATALKIHRQSRWLAGDSARVLSRWLALGEITDGGSYEERD